MIEQFSPDVFDGAPDVTSRPGRRESAQTAATLGLPITETEEWRYSPIAELPLDQFQPALSRPTSDAPTRIDEIVPAANRAATVVVVDGFVVDINVADGWVAKGLDVAISSDRVVDLSDDEPSMFDHLHHAFAPEAIVVRAPQGLAVTEPIVIVNHHQSASTASFPHVVVEAADNSELRVVEWQTSAEASGLSVPRVELDVSAAARLNYLTVQQTGSEFWALARQRSSVATQATLTTGIAAFGGHYARTRTDSRLVGRGSTANLITAYYGNNNQIHDFRTFQHHKARDTRSDLLFKGAQDDASGSIYTGLIHIHPDGAGSNAVQTNRNIKLSEDAWAWSVPNLEIENNDVRCAHASTVSPVDDDQRFYLGARGVPPGPADRLIVAGFFNEVIARMPVAAIQPELQSLIAAKLDYRKVDQ